MKSNKAYYNYTLEFNSVQEALSELPNGNEQGDDNDRCLFYQAQYLRNGKDKYLVNLWTLFTVLCKRAIKKEMRTKRFFLDYDDIAYKADIACEYTLRRYSTYKQQGKVYFIRNFITAARNGAFHALYSEVENDMFLALCKDLDGKPIREAKKRTDTFNQRMNVLEQKPKVLNKDNSEKANGQCFFDF